MSVSASARVYHTEREREMTSNERHLESSLELNGMPPSASRRAGAYIQRLSLLKDPFVGAISGMSERAHSTPRHTYGKIRGQIGMK